MPIMDRSTIWPYDARGEPRDFFYSRYAHPTGAAAEEQLGGLEGGDALLFASGSAATTAVVLALARPGNEDRARRGRVLRDVSALSDARRVGPRADRVRPDRAAPADADIVWVEAPANPMLTVPDWELLRAHPAPVVCDATVSTPVYLRSLDEGADVVVHSATKFLTGSHSALLGATVTRDPERTQSLRTIRTQTGSVSSP